MKRVIFGGVFLAAILATGSHAADILDEASAAAVPDEWYLLETKTVKTVRERDSALSSGLMPTATGLAFMAADGDLECERISVSFADASSKWITLGAGTLLEEGVLYPVEWPPDYRERELTRVNYTCSPVAGTAVAFHIYATD